MSEKRYRDWLEYGTIIQEGDEFRSWIDGTWKVATPNMWGRPVDGSQFRRPIAEPTDDGRLCTVCNGKGTKLVPGGWHMCNVCGGTGSYIPETTAEREMLAVQNQPVVKDSLTTESQTPHCPKCGESGNMIQKANGEWVCHGTHRLDGPTVDHSSEAGEMVEENELRRWQDGIRDAILKRYPSASIDGAGCDSGDPLDFTLAEINQGLNYVEKERDEWRAIAEKIRLRVDHWPGCGTIEGRCDCGLDAALAAYELKAKEGA